MPPLQTPPRRTPNTQRTATWKWPHLSIQMPHTQIYHPHQKLTKIYMTWVSVSFHASCTHAWCCSTARLCLMPAQTSLHDLLTDIACYIHPSDQACSFPFSDCLKCTWFLFIMAHCVHTLEEDPVEHQLSLSPSLFLLGPVQAIRKPGRVHYQAPFGKVVNKHWTFLSHDGEVRRRVVWTHSRKGPHFIILFWGPLSWKGVATMKATIYLLYCIWSYVSTGVRVCGQLRDLKQLHPQCVVNVFSLSEACR